jgi:hypothetical protein
VAITTDLAKVRLLIGDVDSTDPLMYDAEIQVYLDQHGTNLNLVAAECCSAIAAEWGRRYDFESDQQAFKRSQVFAHYTALERKFRARSGVSTVATTRVDGYSDDINYQELEGDNGPGRVRRGYTDPDLPV